MKKFTTHIVSVFLLLLTTVSISFAETMVPIEIAQGTNLIHLTRDYCTNQSDWKKIAEINNLKPPYTIYKKRYLQIPESLLIKENVSGSIAAVSGEVHWFQNGKQQDKVKKGDTILAGQSLKTAENSFVQIIFPDHKFTRIAPNSEFTLNYLFKLADGAVKLDSTLTSGRLVHAIKKRLKHNETFQTRTPVSITGVRGTEFRVKMLDQQTNSIETLSGKVQVDSGKQTVIIPRGKGAKVVKDKPISKPITLPEPPKLPELQSVYRTLPITFDAPKHKTAKLIRLRMCTDKEGNNTFLEQQVPPGDMFAIGSLADNTYYTFITAIDKNQFESAPSEVFQVKVRTIPATPIISSPQNGLVTFSSQVLFKWLKSEHVATYDLQLASDKNFANIIHQDSITDAQFNTPELAPGVYSFRVMGVAHDGFKTLYSPPITFEVTEQPELGAAIATEEGNFVFQWSPMKQKGTYDLEIARDKSFKSIVISETGLTEPSYEITEDLNSGTYYVRVRGVLENGLASQWTPPQSMEIECENCTGILMSVLGFALALIII